MGNGEILCFSLLGPGEGFSPEESKQGGWWQSGWPERSPSLERLQVTTLACSQDCNL